MGKALGILIGGIFIGAVGMEVVHKKCPESFSRLYTSICDATSKAKQAFVSGYRNAMEPKEAAKASV